MISRRTKLLVAAVALVALLAIATVPTQSDSADAAVVEGKDPSSQLLMIDPVKDRTIDVRAGSSVSFSVILSNQYAGTRIVQIQTGTDYSRVSASTDVPDPDGILTLGILDGDGDGGKLRQIRVTVAAGDLAHQNDGYHFFLTLVHTDDTHSETVTDTYTYDVVVKSSLTSANEYNKFLGFIPNTFDGMLGETWFTGLATFIGWLIIGYAVMLIAVPIVSHVVAPKDRDDRATMKRLLRYMCHPIIILNAFGRLFRCMGVSEEIIDWTNQIFYLAFVMICTVVIWKLYTLIIHIMVKRADDKADEIAGRDIDLSGLEPLLRYIGQIVLTVIAVFLILGLFNIDLAAIVLSAGVITLGITMGAQSVLGQFFSGLVLLSTRPFVGGDLIQVGTDSTIYKVRKVNVMFTELENWDNTDINMMPNNLLTASKVKNITRETLVYKVYLTADVAYGTDLALVRTLMQEAALANPHVISDGSVGRPYTRVEAFGDSNITIKMGLYVDDFNSSSTIVGQIRQALYEMFNEKGIVIDYNNIIVHMSEPIVKADAKPDEGPKTA